MPELLQPSNDLWASAVMAAYNIVRPHKMLDRVDLGGAGEKAAMDYSALIGRCARVIIKEAKAD